MQATVMIMCIILAVLEFTCIYLQTLNLKKSYENGMKQGVIFGSIVSALITFWVLHPITTPPIAIVILFGILICRFVVFLYIIAKRLRKEEKKTIFYDYGTPPQYFITGDKHRDFESVKDFCYEMDTRRKDVLIILGDAGFNYYEDARDEKLKKKVSALNITLFCLHGNKEKRPQNIGTYGVRSFCGGKVYYEPQYPNIFFAIDGEIYTFEGRNYMVIGGAHSVDKMRCIEEDKPFWEDEMPDAVIKSRVEHRLADVNNAVYGMMTHTCPIEYLPTEMFVSTRQNAAMKRKPRKVKSRKTFKPDIDRSTEDWLSKIEKKLDYEVWYCGHYHADKIIDKINMMCHEIRPLHTQRAGDK